MVLLLLLLLFKRGDTHLAVIETHCEQTKAGKSSFFFIIALIQRGNRGLKVIFFKDLWDCMRWFNI